MCIRYSGFLHLVASYCAARRVIMESTGQGRVEAPPAHVQLIQMGTAYWVSRIVYAAARLGLADLLAGGPKSAAELAEPTQTHAPSLHRLMRTLAGLGVLSEDENH